MLFMPGAASAVAVLPLHWLSSVGFARSPTGRSFELTAVVEADRMESGEQSSGEADDETFVFTQIDVENEGTVQRSAVIM